MSCQIQFNIINYPETQRFYRHTMNKANINYDGKTNSAFKIGNDPDCYRIFTVEDAQKNIPDIKLVDKKCEKKSNGFEIETELNEKQRSAHEDIYKETELINIADSSAKTLTKDEDERKEVNSIPCDEFLPPDGGWGWVVCISSLYTHGMVGAIGNTFGITYTYILKEYDNGDPDIAFKTCKCLIP